MKGKIMENLLSIENLYVNAGEKEILKGLNLNIKRGEIHVIMGPNGAGKSTLANVILNNPEYKKISGNVLFEGENINDLTKDDIEREIIQIENNDIEVFKIDEKKAKEKGINGFLLVQKDIVLKNVRKKKMELKFLFILNRIRKKKIIVNT